MEVGAGLREEMDKCSLFSAQRPAGPMEGEKRSVVPVPGPSTPGLLGSGLGMGTPWESALSPSSTPHVSSL